MRTYHSTSMALSSLRSILALVDQEKRTMEGKPNTGSMLFLIQAFVLESAKRVKPRVSEHQTAVLLCCGFVDFSTHRLGSRILAALPA